MSPQIPERPASSSYWADVDGDQDVDADDLALVASIWNCQQGQPCYEPGFDRDSDGDIDALDLAAFGNEYDVAPPILEVTNPADNSVVGGSSLTVSGTVSDSHEISWVTINGVQAPVTGGGFQANISLEAGSQTIQVLAADEIGQQRSLTRLVFADQEGPFLTVQSPRHRQSLYSLRPTIAISYTDFYTTTNPAGLQVLLTAAGGGSVDVTGDLAIMPDSASGEITFDLSQDTVYTLTASLPDSLGNIGSVVTTFYVPENPGGIMPPDEPENAGWISGVVYDSTSCDTYLTDCQASLFLSLTAKPCVRRARHGQQTWLPIHRAGRL
jgi:hypothetical protein